MDRFSRIWQQAPAPALHLRRDDSGLQMQANDAAARWAARRGLGEGGLRSLATAVLAAPASHLTWAEPTFSVGCRKVALDDGSTLVWIELGAADDERARLVAETMGVGFWSRDIDAGTGYWDDQMYRIHRRRPEDGPPGFDDWIDQHVHPQDRGWVTALHRRASTNWEPVVDAIFRAPDAPDGERWIQTWTRRLVHDGRRLAFGMHLDVTDRERAQALVQRERERARFVIEAADIGVWERSLDGSASYWNEAMYQLRGLSADDPRPLDEIATACTHPDDIPMMAQAVARHVEEGLPYRFEFRVRRADGRWRWLATQGRAMRDADGRVFGMAGINLDITERKEADALRDEKARAEQASRDKSAFMARLSHELRTPMNAVLGFTQLLASDTDEVPSARQQGRLRRIAEAGAQMMALVDDLLDLASLDNAVPPAAAVPLAVAEIVVDAAAVLRTRAAAQGVPVTTLAAGGEARADRRRLIQALDLLATDALRRQGPGGTIEIGSHPPQRGEVEIFVRDEAPVLDEARRATLFEPFASRVPGGEGGTGIGLSLAERLVRAMGGRVEVVARAGGGNEFRVHLPAAEPALPAAAPEGGAPGLSVLCVEDNPVNLLLVRELIALRPRMTLHEAEDGRSGIALALSCRPDVLLVDLQLPDIDGVEVMKRLRAEPALAGSRFIALSANAMPDQIAAARAAGFDDYWTKPIDFAGFLAGIDRLAYGASRSRSQASPSRR